MVNYTQRVTEPCAFVTKGRQRIKQYGTTVYLNNNDEFEIELFNPTTNKVLAEILIDGKPIGVSYGSGIILRPGERIFLERYLNEARKFKFETYEVNGNDPDTQRAIANNGNVEIKFFTEKPPAFNFYSSSGISWGTIGWPSTGSPSIYTTSTNTGAPFTYTSSITNGSSPFDVPPGNHTFYHSSLNNDIIGTRSGKFSKKFNAPKAMNIEHFESNFMDIPDGVMDLSPMETGRVEKGGHSNQRFEVDSTEFNSYHSWRSMWKILPMSRKPIESTDIKVFCPNPKCGAKQKRHTHKFCPICGTKY